MRVAMWQCSVIVLGIPPSPPPPPFPFPNDTAESIRLEARSSFEVSGEVKR